MEEKTDYEQHTVCDQSIWHLRWVYPSSWFHLLATGKPDSKRSPSIFCLRVATEYYMALFGRQLCVRTSVTEVH